MAATRDRSASPTFRVRNCARTKRSSRKSPRPWAGLMSRDDRWRHPPIKKNLISSGSSSFLHFSECPNRRFHFVFPNLPINHQFDLVLVSPDLSADAIEFSAAERHSFSRAQHHRSIWIVRPRSGHRRRCASSALANSLAISS